ncbi:hypothetical protein F66182_17283, partial [Fusarium sp. NRRL 66182]
MPSQSSTGTIELQTQDAIVPENHVKVVKLEWITQSIKARRALDIDRYVVYHGKVIARPQDLAKKQHIPTSSVKKDSEGILARAIGDAASKPTQSSQSSFASKFASSSSHKGGDSSQQQQYHPPKLYRQSTSEHDATILIPPAPDW